MSQRALAVSGAEDGRVVRWLVPIYSGAILLSAFLLFQVQPMISRMILPWFGGIPAVWTTAMLFFQIILFLGYFYAHLSAKLFGERNQAAAHLAILALALACLPILPDVTWRPIANDDPTWRILGLLGATVGIPYFVLSTTGPLLQAWFAKSCPGVSPYRLYSLSNVGSLAALLSYPFVFEPNWDLPMQARMWSCGFGMFALLCGACAIVMVRAVRHNRHRALVTDVGFIDGVADTETPVHAPLADAPPTWIQRGLWVALPAVASLMLLSTTNFVCDDVAPVPLLWVIPLTLYLLTFIICFDHERWYRRGPISLATLLFVCVSTVRYVRLDALPLELSFEQDLLLYFATMFGVCLVCHGEVVRLKPSASHLTEFYLLLSAGGALGGILVSLVAPHLFATHMEWDCSLLLAYWICAATGWLAFRDWLPAQAGAAGAGRVLAIGGAIGTVSGLALTALVLLTEESEGVIHESRNFYGVVAVVEKDTHDSQKHNRLFASGTKRHGRQYLAPNLRRLPLAYYGETTAPGVVLREMAARRPALRVGLIGLGVGTIATYARPADTFRFYEINPEVEVIARRYFTYLDDCRGTCEVVLGDARLQMEREPPQNYDVLVLDAFTGDSVPVHLLTKEAFEIYRRHLKPDGVMVVHITNQYLDLKPPVCRLAHEFGFRAERRQTDGSAGEFHYRTEYLVLTPCGSHVATPPADALAEPLWTDHYSNLFQILKDDDE